MNCVDTTKTPRPCSYQPKLEPHQDNQGRVGFALKAFEAVMWANTYCMENGIRLSIDEAAEVKVVELSQKPYILTVTAKVLFDGEVVGTGIACGIFACEPSGGLTDLTLYQSTATKAKRRALENAGFGTAYRGDLSEEEDDGFDDPFLDPDESDGQVPGTCLKDAAAVQTETPAEKPKKRRSKKNAVAEEEPAAPVPQPQPEAPVEYEPYAETPVPPVAKELDTAPTEAPAGGTGMTIEQAKAVICNVGMFNGKTMEQVCLESPSAVIFWAGEPFSKSKSNAERHRDVIAAAKVLAPTLPR